MDRWIENRFIVLIYRNYITKYSGRISVLFRGIFIESFAGKMQKKKQEYRLTRQEVLLRFTVD